jgi:DNA-binding CsgD family transcriptional regulator
MNLPPSPVPEASTPLPLAVPSAWLVQAADALALPMALLSAGAELVYANAAFERVLADPRGPLRLHGGHLQPTNPVCAQAFMASLALAAGGQTMALQEACQGLAGQLAPMASRPPGRPETSPAWPQPKLQPVVLTLKTKAQQSLDLYAAYFGLTAAETRVLRSVAEGADPAQTARRFGLKAATVREHLHSIRHKTGQASQQALLLELARLPPAA